MSAILTTGIIQQGQVVVAKPIDLPDGTEVVVTSSTSAPEDDFEEGWDNSPEGIAAWLKWCDSLEPLKITAAEQADTDEWLMKSNAASITTMNKDSSEMFP